MTKILHESQNNLVTTDRSAWLAARRTGIGGSDVAAILGLSKYATPYTVWADKLGLLPEREDTEAMRQGRDLENYVAKRFTGDTGLPVRRKSRLLKSTRYPYSQANIDRHITGQNIGLECKTCSPFRQGEFQDGEYPVEYYLQCLHYLAVTGWDTWYLAVLMLGTAFNVYKIQREKVQPDINAVETAVTEFWESYVLTKTPPPMDGSTATTKALGSIFAASSEGSIDLSHMEQDFIEHAALKEQMEALRHNQELYTQKIKLAMGENTRGECGAWVANWKPRKDGVRVFTIKLK